MKKYVLVLYLIIGVQAGIVEADTVKLNYNWEPGMVARVEYEFSKVRSMTGDTQDRGIAGSYLLKTRAHDRGLLLDFSEHKTEFQGSDPGVNEEMQGFIQRLSAISPSFIISKKGELVEVVGITRLKEDIQKEVNELFADRAPEVKQQMNQLLKDLLSERQIMTQLQQEWNRDVGQWIGAQFESGFAYDIEFSTPVPFLDYAQITTKGQYEYVGRTGCTSNDQGKNCAELKFRSFLDENATREVVSKIFRKMGAEVPESFQLKIDYEVRLITDPQTLRPHKILETRVITAPQQLNSLPVIQTERKAISYVYE